MDKYIEADNVIDKFKPEELASYLYVNHIEYATNLLVYLDQQERIAFNEAIEYLNKLEDVKE